MDGTQLTQLVAALAALLTALATLIKVLQHDGIIKETAAGVRDTNGDVQQAKAQATAAADAAREAQRTINTHLDGLTAAAAAFAKGGQKPPDPSN